MRRLEVFYEYMRMLVQFGLVTLASSCFYPGALLALFENLLHMRANANLYTAYSRRAEPQPAASIGIWATLFDVVAIVAAAYNGFMEAYTSYYLDSSDRLLKVLTGVSCGGLFLGVYLAARASVGPVSRRVATAILRNEVVSSRHLHGKSSAAYPSFVEDSGGCLDNCAGVFCASSHPDDAHV